MRTQYIENCKTKEEAKKGSNDWLELLTFDEEFFEDEDVLV